MTNNTLRLVMTTAAALTLAAVICAIGWRPTPPELERDDEPPPVAPIPTNQQQREDAIIQITVDFLNATHTNWIITVRRKTDLDKTQ